MLNRPRAIAALAAALLISVCSLPPRADAAQDLECSDSEYAQASQQLVAQLKLKFKKSQTRGLATRRAQLKQILSQLSPECAVWFRRGLAQKTAPEHSRLFHTKLAAATRRSLLAVLDARIAGATSAAPQNSSRTQTAPSKKNRADDQYQHLLKVIAGLPNEDRRKPEFLCWMGKLQQPQIDDRLIEWPKVCNRESVGWLDGSPYNGSCLLMGTGFIAESKMSKTFHSVNDVERYQRIDMMSRLKRDVVHSDKDQALALYSLSLLHKNVKRTMEVLFEWERSSSGFNTMPDYYGHIATWIKQKQAAKDSLYGCL